jgi:hypothetical protein
VLALAAADVRLIGALQERVSVEKKSRRLAGRGSIDEVGGEPLSTGAVEVGKGRKRRTTARSAHRFSTAVERGVDVEKLLQIACILSPEEALRRLRDAAMLALPDERRKEPAAAWSTKSS